MARHAHASRVGLTLSYMEDVVTLDVRDDGDGFEPGAVNANGAGGFGLTAFGSGGSRLGGGVGQGCCEFVGFTRRGHF